MSAITIPLYVVDAFTTNENSPFTGNPAGVCILEYDDDISDDIKQRIASEVNLSETAFVSFGWTKGEKLDDEGPHIYRRTIRWFTPTNEVDLCGHATVATTRALLEAQLTDLDPTATSFQVNYDSKFSGKLGAILDKEMGRVTLDFPANPTQKLDMEKHSPWIGDMISVTLGKDVDPSSVCDVQYSQRSKILLLRLQNNEKMSAGDQLKMVSPDFRKQLEIDTGKVVKDIIVTVKGDGKGSGGSSKEIPHFYSRFFAPWNGINEDPVTGLAHTVLTPYWTGELEKLQGGESPTQKMTLLGRQHSDRGGHVHCTLMGDRVKLVGQARITIRGQFSL